MRTLTAVLTALVLLVAVAITQERRPQEVALQAAIRTETVDGNLESAIKQFADIAEKYKSDRSTAATALLHLAGVYQKRGDAQAKAIYERIVREFADQRDVATQARARLGDTGRAASTAMSYRRLWADAGKVAVDLNGTVSHDGRYLSYTDWNAGDLMLRDLATGTARRLTGNGIWPQSNEYAEQSALSRDGSQVAYAWFNGKDRYQLRVAAIKTASAPQPRTVLAQPDVVWIAPHDWSPDGQWLAATIARPDRSAELWLIGVSSGAHRKIRSLEWFTSTKAFFSPDARYLTFDVGSGPPGNNERDIFVAAVDGGSEIAVAHNPGLDRVMGWSPDGTRVLFSSDRSGANALWAQPFRGGVPQGAPHMLKADIGHAVLGVTVAGDLYVGHQVGGRNVYIAEVDFNAGRLLKGPELAVDRYVGNNQWPDWSRDGKYLSLVYARNWMGRDPSISIRSLETRQTREIPLRLTNSRTPLWAPDGASFVSEGIDSEGRRGIFRIDARDGAIAPVVHSRPDEFLAFPEFGPDGRKMYYLRFPGGESHDSQRAIIEFDIASDVRREVFRREGLGVAFVSPDGRSLSTIQRTGGTSVAMVVPVAGGEPREVIRVSHPQSISGPASWSPDSRKLMINTHWAGSDRRETWLVPIDGGPRHTLDLAGYAGRMRVHPDGRRIAYHAGELKFEVWVLENFLPTPSSAKR